MKRREFVGGLCSLLLSERVGWAQERKNWHIGILETISLEANRTNYEAFRARLRDLGYEERRNLRIAYRSADGDARRFPELARELVGLAPDLIVTRGTPAFIAAKDATNTIPIVMTALGEPLMFVSKLIQPGGNVTGLSSFVTELHSKRLELLKEALPVVGTIAALLNMSNPVTPPQWREIEKAGHDLRIRCILLDVRTVAQLTNAIDTASNQGVNAITVGTGALIQDNASLIAEKSISRRLPTMHVSKEWISAGGLMSYGPSYPDLYRRAAGYVDRILKGANPGDLPIEQPNKFEFAVNLKTAAALNLTIPPSLLARADEVIE